MDCTKYIDDYEAGEVFWTVGRTITESDVFLFSGLSGDYNPVHTDYEAAKKTSFGQPIAHGLLALVIVAGLSGRDAALDESAIALLGVEWKFQEPVFFGDTVRAKITVKEARRTSKGDRGILVRNIEVHNQRDSVVQTGCFTTMVKVRSTA